MRGPRGLSPRTAGEPSRPKARGYYRHHRKNSPCDHVFKLGAQWAESSIHETGSADNRDSWRHDRQLAILQESAGLNKLKCLSEQTSRLSWRVCD